MNSISSNRYFYIAPFQPKANKSPLLFEVEHPTNLVGWLKSSTGSQVPKIVKGTCVDRGIEGIVFPFNNYNIPLFSKGLVELIKLYGDLRFIECKLVSHNIEEHQHQIYKTHLVLKPLNRLSGAFRDCNDEIGKPAKLVLQDRTSNPSIFQVRVDPTVDYPSVFCLEECPLKIIVNAEVAERIRKELPPTVNLVPIPFLEE